MRGKLRDKRSLNKHDGFRREENNSRRIYKRASRTVDWIDPVEEEDYYEEDEYLDEVEENDGFFPKDKTRK